MQLFLFYFGNDMENRVKEIRETLKLSQKEFAKALEIPSTTVSKYERGEFNPSFDVLAKIGKCYMVNLNWLLNGEGSMFTTSSNLSCNLGGIDPLTQKAVILMEEMSETGKRDSLRHIEKEKFLSEMMQEKVKAG